MTKISVKQLRNAGACPEAIRIFEANTVDGEIEVAEENIDSWNARQGHWLAAHLLSPSGFREWADNTFSIKAHEVGGAMECPACLLEIKEFIRIYNEERSNNG